MTIKECYEAMGGDYEDVLKRLMNEARIQKFALMFKKDPSMSQLTQAMDAGDVETAFRAAHTLKGICANLGFKSLFEVSYDIRVIWSRQRLCGQVCRHAMHAWRMH